MAIDLPPDLIALERSAWAEIQKGALTVDTARAVHEGIAAFVAGSTHSRYAVEMELKKTVRHAETTAEAA